MRKTIIHSLIFLALLTGGALAQTRGILGKQAPSWRVDKWHNLPAGITSLDIDDYRGKVLYLYCFQSWCPGCHKHGFPTLRKMIENFDGNDDVAYVAIQTVFEGFASNTFQRAKEVGRQYELAIPIGQSGEGHNRSEMMSYYRTGGTPWTIIIDQSGTVRYNDFRIDAPYATRFINRLLESESNESKKSMTTAKTKSPALPLSRAGGDVVGSKLDLSNLRWLNTEDNEPLEVAGKVTLVRWWTDTCPFCSASLPAIEGFTKMFPEDEFQTIAVYHPKPPRYIPSTDIIKAAQKRDYYGAVALDQNWEVLKQNYLSKNTRHATSVSFLLDQQGIIRFVHPGPEIHPSNDPELFNVNRDYEEMILAIKALLSEAK